MIDLLLQLAITCLILLFVRSVVLITAAIVQAIETWEHNRKGRE